MGGTVSLPSPQYIDVRYPDNKLAFRYDPTRAIVEIRGTPRSERADTEIKLWLETVSSNWILAS